MPSYSIHVKRDRMQVIIDAIDAHATVEGYLEIGDGDPGPTPPWAFGNRLVKIDLEDPSFDDPTAPDAVINMHITPPATGLTGIASGGGTATVAQICDGAGNIIVSRLRVGTAIDVTHHVAITALAINIGQTVTCTAGKITHAP